MTSKSSSSVVLLMVLFLGSLDKCIPQELRDFPPLFNIGKDRPLVTQPSQSTCGIPTRNAYCKSSPFVASITNCRQAYCVQECPRRVALPSHTNMLAASNYGPCVTTDTTSVRPGSSAGDFAAIFNAGTDCYVVPFSRPVLGANGAFSLTFWLLQTTDFQGTVIEKVSADTQETIFRVTVSPSRLIFAYRSLFGAREVEFTEDILKLEWTHLSIQVYDTSISMFVDGLDIADTARSTKGLVGAVVDGAGKYRVGQAHSGQGQYQGRLQDVRFYGETLTNREITEVYSDTLPEVLIQSSCRCPPTHPRIKPVTGIFEGSVSRFCIRNGVPDNTGDELLRLNNDSHPMQYMNDRDSNSMWVSTFLDDITIELDLGDQYQVFYVILQFYSPFPKVVLVQRKVSESTPWETWQMYAHDCQLAFGQPNNGPLPTATSINCIQFGTNGFLVPYSNGNITFNPLAPEPVARPGHNDFYNSEVLGEFVLATRVRVRFQDHFYVAHPRHKYYALTEYTVTARCNCHGHAVNCDSSEDTYVCQCLPGSNTIGNKCDRCAPLYNDKPFRVSTQTVAYNCRPCECFGHADSCIYNPTLDPNPSEHSLGGGGQCVDCQHNTEGDRCDRCMVGYYRPEGYSLYAEDACQPCDCNTPGITFGEDPNQCEQVKNTGQCLCKAQVKGRRCDECLEGYFNLQAASNVGCEPCGCRSAGTINGDFTCHPTLGQCRCKKNTRELRCSQCKVEYYNLDAENPDGCSPCLCNPLGADDRYCDPITGQCRCKPNMEGQKCDRCKNSFYDLSSGCEACNCDQLGTVTGTLCDSVTGACQCKLHVEGARCDTCKDGYYQLGGGGENGCLSCGCDPAGTVSESALCDKTTGACTCKANVEGRPCNMCRGNTFNLTASNPEGCQACQCDLSGTVGGDSVQAEDDLACDQNTGECTCLANRVGLYCESCAPDYYVVSAPGGGCQQCSCFALGTVPDSVCDPMTGQCRCRSPDTGIGGQNCDTCIPGWFNLDTSKPTVRTCYKCGCDSAGSVNDTCHPVTGQCECKPFTTGRQCGDCQPGTSNLRADNPYGCSKVPSQQPPPQYIPLSETSLRLYWGGPDYPNGVILNYTLYRDGEAVVTLEADSEADTTEYIDTGLTPYTLYTYQVEATNADGSTRSPPVTYRTPSGVPSGDLTLQVRDITAHGAMFEWSPPSSANGVIQRYILSSVTASGSASGNEEQSEVHYEGLSLNVRLDDLIAYTNYTFTVQACTESGCVASTGQVVITKAAIPEQQRGPNITALSPSQLLVEWEPPERPNGVIIFYELWIRGLPDDDTGIRDPVEMRIFRPGGTYDPLPGAPEETLPAPNTSFVASGLEAFTVYEFQVLCENSIGKAASPWTQGRTAESDPVFMPAPVVVPLSSTALNVSWEEPGERDVLGIVQEYHVYELQYSDPVLNPFAPREQWMLVAVTSWDDRWYEAIGFLPYSTHEFVVAVCNMVACANSSQANGTTLPAAPVDMKQPLITGFNSTVNEVTWNPPTRPNGPPPNYRLIRQIPSFNNPPPLVGVGTRFPGTGYYMFPPETIPQGVAFTGFDLWFKTESKDGLIIFAGSEGGQEEFIVIQLRSGRPWFLFDPQACLVSVSLDIDEDNNTTFSDGQWHHLVVRRHTTTALLVLDDVYKGAEQDTTCEQGNIIGRNTGVYVGGLPDDYILQRNPTDNREKVNRQSFKGCLRDVKILKQSSPDEVWEDLDWDSHIGRSVAKPSWEGCPFDLQQGYHFLGAGFIQFPANYFTGGRGFEVSFDMRTDRANAMLVYAYGADHVFFLLQLVAGDLHMLLSDGTVTRTLVLAQNPPRLNLCNGQKYNIVVKKRENTIQMSAGFDDEVIDNGEGQEPVNGALSSYLWIGGVEPNSEAERSLVTNELLDQIQPSFGGCFSGLRITKKPFSETSFLETKNVRFDGCPPAAISPFPCQALTQHVIYEGANLDSMDTGLLPFTEYMYAVEAYNEVGSTISPWNSGRTREGAPEGVSGPTSVIGLSGWRLQVTWIVPTGRTGLVTSFIIAAYHLDKPTSPPVTATFNNTITETVTEGELGGLTPDTRYLVKLIACTLGGCTESENGTLFVTQEEAPGDLEAPRVLDRGGTYIHVGWSVPASPNGNITGYFLFMDTQEVFSGAVLSFNITELSIYTGYVFFIRACTRVGCSDGPPATLSTSQLPPESVAPPTLTVLGKYRIQANWAHPEQLNGVLERYLLYLSQDPATPEENYGAVAYNSTDFFLYYVLTNLTAGETYFVRVGACTGGGCTVSEPSEASTVESAPEGIPDPIVTSPSPSQLMVWWDPPALPNGEILQYKVFHNGLFVYNVTAAGLEQGYLISGLMPWSPHKIRIEACTRQGCGSSAEVTARTQEAPPVGSMGLELRVVGSRQVDVRWNPIDTANGHVTYDVYFEGLEYVDPAGWDYSVRTSRRSLYSMDHSDDAEITWVPVTEGLIPYSQYYVQVNASNTQGFILSNTREASMPTGSPDGVAPPTLTSPDPTSIRAQWGDVGRWNAEQSPVFQLQFREQTEGSIVENLFAEPTAANTFLMSELLPFTAYEFRLVAINVFGETPSEWAQILTKQDVPVSVDPPLVTDIQARSVRLEWQAPYQPNGIVTQYKLFANGFRRAVVAGNITEREVDKLTPFTAYQFEVEVCTIAGCVRSAASRQITTLKSTPEGIAAPILVSQSPTVILVVWTSPQNPNGDILQYLLERRLAETNDDDNSESRPVTIVQTFLPSEPKQYRDASPVILPSTTYEYRVVAETAVGKGYSPWAAVTTRSARPGGVSPPQVTVLGSTSLEITWQPPIQPNGRLTNYIIALPLPRFDVRNVSLTRMVVENLVPYSEYNVTVTACSDGGCTSSTPTQARTSPALPDGVHPPVATPHGTNYISILWQPPDRPNGPSIRYELTRSTLARPLMPDDTDDLNTWRSIYQGTGLYHDDRAGLTMYTEYAYRVIVYNDFGYTSSNLSDAVFTYGGQPTVAATVEAYSINHTAIEVRWVEPSVEELQGGVATFLLNVSSLTGNSDGRMLEYPPGTTAVIVGGLEPNTVYQAVLTLLLHGGATITSDPVNATTQDGAPEGLLAPQLQSVNNTAVRVSWQAPSKPNGIIRQYNIYMDSELVVSGIEQPGAYVLTDLLPYTIFQIQVEACSEFACTKSPATEGTTAESTPGGVDVPSVVVQGTDAVSISWDVPESPNGIILRYDLLKKTEGSCNSSEPIPSPSDGCQYFECTILESFCGDQCYSGQKTCCDGILHDNRPNYVCCGRDYLPSLSPGPPSPPGSVPASVCCGGVLHQPLDRHECCGERYVEVLAGERCCVDPEQNRVDIGPGDECCGSVPYSTRGPQTCCHGVLHESLGRQCCGGEMVMDSLVCCGDGDTGQAFSAQPAFSCCGAQYVSTDTTICCTEQGGEKVHSFSSAIEKQTANVECCNTELISRGLSCCAGSGYNPLYQVCADISNGLNGCGSGMICPSSESATAFCNRCDFNRNTLKCGAYIPRVAAVTDTTTTIGEESSLASMTEGCWSDATRIYSGMDFAFTDTGLSPYTQYQYQVAAVNGAGIGRSDWVTVTTDQKLPEGVMPPTVSIEAGRIDSIILSWEPPKHPNGIITMYMLLRDGIEIYRDPSGLLHVDRNAVRPYTTYIYVLRVCNGAGCVDSDPVPAATLQAPPGEVQPPSIEQLSSTQLQLSWQAPLQPNGFLTQYELYLVAPEARLLMSDTAQVTEFTLSDLQAYMEYYFVLSACTEMGCTNSSTVSAYTLQDLPQDLLSPKLLVINSTAIEVHWSEPSQPNGPIAVYKLYRQGSSQAAAQVIFTAANYQFMFLDASLLADSSYMYKVEAVNGAGATMSDVTVIRTPALTPLGIAEPTEVTVLSPTSIYVQWDAPAVPNGIIDQYKILLNAGTPDLIEIGVGVVFEYTIKGLDPYTEYSVRMMACIRDVDNSCGTGPAVTVRTLTAAPLQMLPPVLVASGPSIVDISWKPPVYPNGIITQYRIHRRLFGTTGDGFLINMVDGDILAFSNRGSDILPFTKYEYKVIAANSRGDTASTWVMVQTLEAPPQVINAPKISNVAPHSISLAWEEPLQANGVIQMYRIESRMVYMDPTAEGLIVSIRVPGDVRNSSISGLNPYQEYELRIVAMNNAGEVASPWVEVTTEQAAPADIGLFNVEKVSTGFAAILRWDTPGKPNGVVNNYIIYEEGNVNPLYQGLNRVYEYRKLEPFTEYTVFLEACTLGGCGRSVKQKFTTAEIPPQNQPEPSVLAVNATYVHLQWQGPMDAYGKITKYQVLRRSEALRRKRAVSEPEVVYEVLDPDQETYEYIDTNLKPFTQYEYSIRTINSKGSTESPWQVIQTLQSKPENLAPPEVSHIGNEYDRVLVTWSPPDSPNGIIQNYRLQRNSSVPWGFLPSEPLEYTDTGLKPFTVYAYSVEACNGGGCVLSDPSYIQTLQSKPLFVPAPTVRALDSTRVFVQWTPPQVTNGEIQVFHLLVDNNRVYSGLGMEHTVTNLVPFQMYMFVISACTVGGCTESQAVMGQPEEAPPQSLAPPQTTVTGSKSIEISWQPPSRPNGIITSYVLRRDGDLILETGLLFYVDYDVAPGSTHAYTVTAYNSQGSVTSLPTTATTFASAPEGVAPPFLDPLSSTSIQASWLPPLKPNGVITHYVLLNAATNLPVFSDNALSAVISGLDHYTEYSFRVRACTAQGCTTSDARTVRTLGAPPLGLSRPHLTPIADAQGAHAGVLAEWEPPRQPNAETLTYQLYRRLHNNVSPDLTGGPRALIYRGEEMRFLDNSEELQADTEYDYMVTALNGEGQVASEWATIRTNEAPPEGVPPPRVLEVTTDSISIRIDDPEVANGRLLNFHVYLNDTKVLETRSMSVTITHTSLDLSDASRLSPNTMYALRVDVCTAGGCTSSPAVMARTLTGLPKGVTAPVVSNITATSMDVTWEATPQRNTDADSLLYELMVRRACPHPYADSDDAVFINCTVGAWLREASGDDLFYAQVDDLQPYTRYQLKVQVSNEVGTALDPPITTAVTEPAAPQYRETSPLRIQPTGNVINVDWSESFFINGEISSFSFFSNSERLYQGFATSYRLSWDSVYKEYEFQVLLETLYGQASSPKIVFNGQDAAGPNATSPVAAVEQPFYEEVWFIALIALLVIVLLFLLVALCLWRSGHRLSPQIRERMPLQSESKKTLPPIISPPYMDPAYNDAGQKDIPRPPPPIPHIQVSNPYATDPHVGYINPPYSSIPPYSSSLVDYNLDQISKTSSEWDNEEDEDEEEEDKDGSLAWLEGNMLNTRSGLHSLAYGDDYDVDRDQSVSVLKEHTMFTDTHI